MTKVILASSSQRRQDLLKQISVDFEVRIPNVDESSITDKNPKRKAMKLAQLKSKAVPINEEEIIITCDTLISINNEILEKPKNKEEARQMLTLMSGNTHTVYSAVVIKSTEIYEEILSATDVTFFELEDKEIETYIATDEPYDKAGGYGIQSFGAVFVEHIRGDYNTIVGLPISLLYQKIKPYI